MSTTYNALEGELSIRPVPSVARSGAENAVALVGGYDADNADPSVTAGEARRLADPTSATDVLGDSELAHAAAAVADNGVGTVYAVPVPETETTETASSTTSITLTNDPIFDPTVHPDHSITVTDTVAGSDLSVEVVYESPVPTPTESDTAYVNPIIGAVETDASSDYEVTYTYGDYLDATETAADLSVRYICPLTESASLKGEIVDDLQSIAADFDFKRAVVGATPNIDVAGIGSYSPDEENIRLVEVAPARADRDGTTIRTAAAVCGLLAAQDLGPDGSVLYDEVSGITSLHTEYRGSDAKSFSQVTSVTRTGRIGTAETTAASEQFRNIYAAEIIDAVALDLFDVARDYAGGPQDLGDLRTRLSLVCERASSGSPPLLGFADDSTETPYDVSTSLDPNDNAVANGAVSIVPHPIAEEVNIAVSVADGFVQFEGAN